MKAPECWTLLGVPTRCRAPRDTLATLGSDAAADQHHVRSLARALTRSWVPDVPEP